MALLQDFTDPFGGGRTARVPDWGTDHLEADLDLGGFDLIGLSSDLLDFEPQEAHTVFAGPTGGSRAEPAFRLLTASEVGAQPQNDSLDDLSDATISAVGLHFLEQATPPATRFPKIGPGGQVTQLSASELAEEIDEFIESVGGIAFDTATADIYTLTINGSLHVDADVWFAGPFATGPGSIQLNAEDDVVMTLTQSGEIAIVTPPAPNWNAWAGTASRASFNPATATLTNCAQTIKAVIDDLISMKIFGA